MVTFVDPAHFMSKSAAPPLEGLGPPGQLDRWLALCALNPPRTPPAGSTLVLLHQLLATLTQPSALKLIVPCYRNHAAIVLLGETRSCTDRKSGRTTTDCHVRPPWGLTTQTAARLALTLAESLLLSTPTEPLHWESLLPPCLLSFLPIHAPSLTSPAALWPTSVTPQTFGYLPAVVKCKGKTLLPAAEGM